MNNLPHIFIPSYKRANNLKTVNYLEKFEYPSKLIHVVVDDETPDLDDYKYQAQSRGFKLHIFNLNEAQRRYDFVYALPASMKRTTGMARNMFFDIAKELNIKIFGYMDDDTLYFSIRPNQVYKRIANKDDIKIAFALLAEFIDKHKIGLIALPQIGDIFHHDSDYLLKYKTRNCIFFNTDYIEHGERGFLGDDISMFMSVLNEGLFTGSLWGAIYLNQANTAKQAGGLTEIYKEAKLMSKALICPIQFPSCVWVEKQKMNGGRIHHHIDYRYLVPKILKLPKSKINTIRWDAFEEDVPFSNEPRRLNYEIQ